LTLPHNYHPHSRYTLKEAPWGFNASDLIHNDISGPVFDLGVDLEDRHGFAYIRVTDVEEMARVLGMATRDEVAALKLRIKELNAEVNNVPDEVEKLKDGLSVLVSDFLDRVVPRTGDDSSLPAPEEIADGQSEFDLEISGTDIEGSGQDSDASGDKGSSKLSSDKLDGFGFDSIK
jgi:hypothetical protein